MTYSTRTTCRCCGSAALTELFSLGEQRVSGFFKPPCKVCGGRGEVPYGHDGLGEVSLTCTVCDGKPYEDGPLVPVTLQLCRDCTLVQAKHSPAMDMYSGHYWYASGRNQTMRDALADVAESVAKVAKPKAGDIWVDVGANDGTLLNEVEGHGLLRVGVEPANNLAEQCSRHCEVLVNDFWSAEKYNKCLWIRQAGTLSDNKAKVITAIGMLYDLEDPNRFVADIAKVLAPDGVFIAQLMCLKQTVQMRDVGNFAHEHLEFYSLGSMGKLLHKHGLWMFDVEENSVNGGSYRMWIQHEGGPIKQTTEMAVRAKEFHADQAGLDQPDTYAHLFQEMKQNRDKVVEFIKSEVHGEGQTCWVYGASTKGNVICQWYGLGSKDVIAAADRSPEKWGRQMAGSRIPIASEEDFRKAAPDYALALPYSFMAEFVQREMAWLEGGGVFIVPLPVPMLVGVREGKLYKVPL